MLTLILALIPIKCKSIQVWNGIFIGTEIVLTFPIQKLALKLDLIKNRIPPKHIFQ